MRYFHRAANAKLAHSKTTQSTRQTQTPQKMVALPSCAKSSQNLAFQSSTPFLTSTNSHESFLSKSSNLPYFFVNRVIVCVPFGCKMGATKMPPSSSCVIIFGGIVAMLAENKIRSNGANFSQPFCPSSSFVWMFEIFSVRKRESASFRNLSIRSMLKTRRKSYAKIAA